MKNTKKIISLVLAICMLASLAISASAANTVDASWRHGHFVCYPVQHRGRKPRRRPRGHQNDR